MGENAQDIIDGNVDQHTGEWNDHMIQAGKRPRFKRKRKETPSSDGLHHHIKDEEDAIRKFEIFTENINHVRDPKHFSVTVKRLDSGWLVIQWYDRSSWVDSKIERKILFSNGQIYEDFKKIGSYV